MSQDTRADPRTWDEPGRDALQKALAAAHARRQAAKTAGPGTEAAQPSRLTTGQPEALPGIPGPSGTVDGGQ